LYDRTTVKYGERGIRYAHMEAGHAAQNVLLQAVSLNLGTVVIGAFQDEQVRRVLHLPEGEHPLYIMPLGRQ
jgi:SagB-type dehydrogenase family enzyme